jgi:hypothetical protein
MKAFYSILYTTIRPIAKEQLSIGLFMSDSKKSYFHFSNEKVSLAKRLLTNSSYSLLRSYLEGLRKDIQMRDDDSGFSDISPEYFNYLSNYCNNLISFSKPTPINIEFNKESFEKLFEKLVFNYERNVEHIVKNQTVDFVRKKFYPQIKERVNLNQTLTPLEIPNLIIPKVKVDFIGKNDIPVAGGAVNFEAGMTGLVNNISHFVTLISALETDNKTGQYYLIGEEPSKKNFPEQHSAWKQVHDSNQIDFVPLKEIEKISHYLDKHNVHPFIEE